MIKLLRFEFYKLVRQKSLYICGGVMLALLILNVALYKVLSMQNLEQFGFEFNFTGPQIMLSSLSNASFTLVWSIFTVLFACGDFSHQTVKNIYSRGYSKTEVYFAKYIVTMVATVIVFALTVLIGLAAGSALFKGGAEGGSYAGLIFGQLVVIIAYISLIFAVSLMLRKTGLALALAIVGPTAITLILTIFDTVLKLDRFAVSQYWLDGMLAALADVETTAKTIWIDVALSVVYAAAFTVAGWLVNRKRDV